MRKRSFPWLAFLIGLLFGAILMMLVDSQPTTKNTITFRENCSTGHGLYCMWTVDMPRVVLGKLKVLQIDRDRFIQDLEECNIEIIEEGE